MRFFSEVKTTQVATRLLQKRGGEMSYLKLIKLLYLIDRAALDRWGRPVTFDDYYSMEHGQVLSRTLDLINDEDVPPGQTDPSFWHQHISAPSNHEVKLLQEAPIDELSRVEIALIDEIYAEYGQFSRWQLRDLHHTLPEYKNPGKGHIPTEMETILQALAKTKDEITAIIRELKSLEVAQNILNK